MSRTSIKKKIAAILGENVVRPMGWVKPEDKLIQPGNEPDAKASASAGEKLKGILGQRGDRIAIGAIIRELNAVTVPAHMQQVVKMLVRHHFSATKNMDAAMDAVDTALGEAVEDGRLNAAWKSVLRNNVGQAKPEPRPSF